MDFESPLFPGGGRKGCVKLGIQALTTLGDGSVLGVSAEQRSGPGLGRKGQALMQERDGGRGTEEDALMIWACRAPNPMDRPLMRDQFPSESKQEEQGQNALAHLASWL